MVHLGACSPTQIETALSHAAQLLTTGVPKLVGQILLQMGFCDEEAIQGALFEQRKDRLRSTAIFQTLSDEQLTKVAEVAEEKRFGPSELVFLQDEAGDAFYLIISGQVSIFRTIERGREPEIARLGPGETLGEMALLTGEPRSASVRALKESTLLSISAASFDVLLREMPSLAGTFVPILAQRLRQTDVRLEQELDHGAALSDFLLEQTQAAAGPLLGASSPMKALRRQIENVAPTDQPVLISGPLGTEKAIVARHLHESSPRSDNHFLVFDAASLPALGEGQNHGAKRAKPQPEDEAEHDGLVVEMSQCSALFGHERGGHSFAKQRRLGCLEVADGGTLYIEHVERLHLTVQQQLLDFMKTGRFARLGDKLVRRAQVRIVAGTDVDLRQRVEDGTFLEEFHQLLATRHVRVPALSERKKDLSLFIAHYLKKHSALSRNRLAGLTQEAMNVLFAYDWPENLAELEETIRRGVHLAQGEHLGAEHIFVGISALEKRERVNLIRWEPLRKLMQSRFYPGLPQLFSVVGLFVIILVALLGPQQAERNVALPLVWAIWWPALVASWFVVARLWCSLCPMAAVGDVVSRLGGRRWKVPSFLRRYALPLSAAGFFTIMWAEQSTHMSTWPLATAVLLLSILSGAVVFGFLFDRRAWCRYACPLGGASAGFATAAPLELRANTNICKNECLSHACYTGNEEVAGCPMYQGAFSLQSNEYCILCGNCLKLCPHQSPRLNLRFPGAELWANRQPIVSIDFLIPVLLATQVSRLLVKGPLEYAWPLLADSAYLSTFVVMVAALAAVLASFGGVAWLLARRSEESPRLHFSRLTHVAVPLILAAEFAYHLMPFLLDSWKIVPMALAPFGIKFSESYLHVPPFAVKGLQVLVVLGGMAVSLFVLQRMLRLLQSHEVRRLRPLLRSSMLLLAVLYIVLYSF
ncbi:MAG: sigma 54-interacting transcriptional regulator [Candidatus Tectomicrobia bacterium]|nr:sigma 54-interacting transcriptional regulator [Candidatus Tectomicrobia bacterium]